MKKTITRSIALILSLLLLMSGVNLTAYAKTISTPTSVSAYNCLSGVKVKWKSVKNASGYIVYKKNSKNESWKKLAETQNKYYIDKSVKNKHTYYYSVKAYKGKSKSLSNRSKTVSCYYVSAPVVADAYEGGGNAVIELSDSHEWYYVYRKIGKNGKYKEIQDAEISIGTKNTNTVIEDTTVLSGKTYYYKIKSAEKRDTKLSAYSKEIKISCKYYAGECARNGHKKLHKVKTVNPTEVLDGYTLYSCDCKKRVCARNIKKATGNPAPNENKFAYNESVKRYNKAVEYLDKVRKNDKTDLLQVFSGTTEQIRVLKKESDKIVKDCSTNYQKYKAIYSWVQNNVADDAETSTYPFEVLRKKQADCQGASRLVVDLLRLQNIPCAVIIGYIGDTKNVLTEKNMDELCGSRHDWILAYVGGRWVFADARWSRFDPKDDFDIPQWYYTIAADYAAVYYKGMNMKMTKGAYPTYINGRYYSFDGNGRQSFYGFGYFSHDFSFACDVNDCVSQKNKPESFSNYLNTENVKPGEVLTGLVYTRQEQREKDEKLLHISYYNGRNVDNTTFKLNGKKYLSEDTVYSDYSGKYLSMKNGKPVLKTGETIKLKISYSDSATKCI